MPNEMVAHSKHRGKVTHPKPVYLWTAYDVLTWYERHCSEHLVYLDNFSKNEITGRALLRITDHSLLRMGISNYAHREAIWREIVKQRLKTDFMEIRNMELMDHTYS